MKETVITARNRTNVRLRTTLALLADRQAAGTAVTPSELMAQAVAEVPFDATEAELLSGGIPRGYKALTTATSKLVKAGWLVKGRAGWTATEDGVRAVRAFDDADQFVNAMLSGAPIPEHVKAPVHAPPSPEQLGEESTDSAEASSDAPSTSAPSALSDSSDLPDSADSSDSSGTEDPTPPDVTPTIEEVPAEPSELDDTSSAVEDAPESSVSDTSSGSESGTSDSSDAWHDQPQSVTLSGDFDPLFGEAGHWSLDLRELQLDYDSAANTWARTLHLPAGTYQYKIVVNSSWEENYGRYGERDGANHELHLLSDTAVTFRFDYATKDVATS